jgi:O-antigen/teichoic acid export membrane protein
VTLVAETDGRGERQAAQRYVSSAFFMLLGLALLLGACFVAAYEWIPWPAVYNVSSSRASSEAGFATAVFAGCFLANLPLGIVERVQLGYQEGFINGLWQALGSVLGLCGVLLGIAAKAGLPWLVLAMAGAPLCTLLLNGIVLFLRRRPYLCPRLGFASRETGVKIVKLGLLFFVLQLAVALAFTSDNVVVARLFGASAVTDYFVPMRLFSIAPMVLVILLNPLWPAYGEAAARGDFPWVRSTVLRSIALAGGLTALASAILVLFGTPLVHFWVGSDVSPSFWLLLGMGTWAVLSATGNALAMFLNGVNVIGLQAIAGSVMAGAALAAKIFLGNAVGLPGVIWGTVIAYTLFTVIPFAVVTPHLLRRHGIVRATSMSRELVVSP